MHVVFSIQKNPIILLSEEVSEKLGKRIKTLIVEKGLSHLSSITEFMDCFFENILLDEHIHLDISYFFDNTPDDLKVFIALLSEAFDDIKAQEEVKEKQTIAVLQEKIVHYYYNALIKKASIIVV